MQLYLANCTKQILDFQYRVPEDRSKMPYRTSIAPGTQQVIWKPDSLPVLMAIVDQMRPYGLVAVNEVDRTREFIGFCYSIDKPVPMDVMMVADDHNTSVLTQRGVEMRKQTAVAMEHQMFSENDGLAHMELEIVEDTKGETPRVAEAIEVNRRNSGKPTSAREQRRARRA
jgi:hypothetical protein